MPNVLVNCFMPPPGIAPTPPPQVDIVAPVVPTGVVALKIVPNSIRLSWDPSTDPNVGNLTSGIFKYEVTRDSIIIANVLSPNGGLTSIFTGISIE